MILQRWSLPKEGYLPLFMLLSCASSAAILFFVKVQFLPPPKSFHLRASGAPEIILVGQEQKKGASQVLANLQFLSKYALLPSLPKTQISHSRLVSQTPPSPLAQLPPPPLAVQPLETGAGETQFLPLLVSLLPGVDGVKPLEIKSIPAGQITFSGAARPLTPLPDLPLIPTETPLRASVYHITLGPLGEVHNILLVETCGNAEADRTGITLLRKIRFAPVAGNAPLPASLKARIFWPQTAYQLPAR
jgi:hypothetical protein